MRLSESDDEIEILLGEETQISERVLKRRFSAARRTGMRLANCMPRCTAGSPEIGEHAIVSFVTLKPPVRRDEQCHCKIA
jgi:hypothetical protein